MTHTTMLIYVFNLNGNMQIHCRSNTNCVPRLVQSISDTDFINALQTIISKRRLWLKCYILYCLFWPIPHGNCCLNRDRQNLANTWLLYLLKNCHSYFEVDKQLFTSILENTFNLIDFGHSNDSLSYIMHLITFKCILRQHIEKTKQQETL